MLSSVLFFSLFKGVEPLCSCLIGCLKKPLKKSISTCNCPQNQESRNCSVITSKGPKLRNKCTVPPLPPLTSPSRLCLDMFEPPAIKGPTLIPLCPRKSGNAGREKGKTHGHLLHLDPSAPQRDISQPSIGIGRTTEKTDAAHETSAQRIARHRHRFHALVYVRRR